MVGCRWRRTIRTPPTNRNCTMGSRQKPSPDSTRVTGYSAVHSVGENRASHELAACRQKRRPPESRPMIVDLWSANTKLAPNRLLGSVGSVRMFVADAAPRLAHDIITIDDERVLMLHWRRLATRESPRTAAGPTHCADFQQWACLFAPG